MKRCNSWAPPDVNCNPGRPQLAGSAATSHAQDRTPLPIVDFYAYYYQGMVDVISI
jgi:hypothetical protein